MAQPEVAPATPSRKGKVAAKAGGSAKKKSGKKNQPGRYSQLVVDTLRKLGERNGSSLAKIYGEAKKVSWFDQQNGRTYLKYSIKALVQNDTLLQVKGVGANGSFRLNKKKLEVLAIPIRKAAAAKPAAKKKAAGSSTPKKSLKKKAKPAAKRTGAKAAAKSPKKAATRRPVKKVKKAAKPKALKAKKA